MSSKGKSIIICLLLFLIIVFIYTPLRTEKLERQFANTFISSVEKIVISLVSFEKNKKLKSKNLSEFYKIIKNKYPNIALVTIADRKNNILKAGKDEKFIKSNKTFDTMLDGFTRDEYRSLNKNSFKIRYFDHNRFYISARNVEGGKILIIFPYKLETKVIIQLGMELLLILIFSVILTAIIIVIKNKKSGIEAVKLIRKEKELYDKNSAIDIRKDEHHKGKDKKRKPLSGIEIDSLNDTVYELFKNIIRDCKPQNLSLYLFDKEADKLYMVYELKGSIFIKTDNPADYPFELNDEILEALANSSIILKEKGSEVTIPLSYGSSLLGAMYLKREKQLSGPEIRELKSGLQVLVEPLCRYYV